MNSMNKSMVISVLTSALCLVSANTHAAGGHDGHKGGGNKSGGGCKTTIINHFSPKRLTTVAPESEFSFWVRGIKDPEQVTVTAKKIPVNVVAEDKEYFFSFKGNLPASLTKTAARIQVTVESKKCPAKDGWLLKISE